MLTFKLLSSRLRRKMKNTENSLSLNLEQAHIEKVSSANRAEYYRNWSVGYSVSAIGWISFFLQSAIQHTEAQLPFIYALILLVGCLVLGGIARLLYTDSKYYGRLAAEYEAGILNASLTGGSK